MARELVMPKLGAEMKTGRIVEWRGEEGEWVEEKEVVVVIETDKITYDVECPASGFLHIVTGVEEEVPVSATIGFLCETKQELETVVSKAEKPETKRPVEPAKEPEEGRTPMPSQPSQSPRPRREIRISPLARKLAQAEGLDMATIEGSGPRGRIKKRDVLRSIESRKEMVSAPPPERVAAVEPGGEKKVKGVIPLRGMRKIIARRLYSSLQQMAQFTDMGEMDVSETVAFRQKLLEQENLIGARISYNAIFVKIAALILKEIPIFNASVVEEEIHLWEQINIGMALALEDGLIVPVIRDAEKKAIVQIQRELEDFIERGRGHRLTPDEISEGTFTISNFGSYGAFFGTPIINPPEVALLGLGVIRQVPAVVENEIVVRWSMNYSLTMDHRVIDGATGGKFIQRMREIVASPHLLGVMW